MACCTPWWACRPAGNLEHLCSEKLTCHVPLQEDVQIEHTKVDELERAAEVEHGMLAEVDKLAALLDNMRDEYETEVT